MTSVAQAAATQVATTQRGGRPADDATTDAARHDRQAMIAYALDADTEIALREGLAEAGGIELDIRRGGIRAAIVAMRKGATPRSLIIDVGGEAQPLSMLSSLADVLEPDVKVLVVGDPTDVDFYRQITRGLGSVEYLAKPLSRDMVLRHFAPVVSGRSVTHEATEGGRILCVTGVRGGSGATTIAAYLAWYFAVDRRRHTALLDADLYRGSAAMLLGIRVTGGLRTAMETPDRVDSLFIERSAQILDSSPAADRLAVLASEERLTETLAYMPGAAEQLTRILRKRYNIIVADVPLQQVPHYRDLMNLAHQRILVMDPTLVAMRDMLRMLALPSGGVQARRPIVVLNRLGQPGGLTLSQVQDGLKLAPDVVVGDFPSQLGPAATLGLPQTALRGKFRASIVELAKQAAFERLLDNTNAAPVVHDRRSSDKEDIRRTAAKDGKSRLLTFGRARRTP
ncbi:MAG: AAA family ATPase [Janthinobacterium lividum]